MCRGSCCCGSSSGAVQAWCKWREWPILLFPLVHCMSLSVHWGCTDGIHTYIAMPMRRPERPVFDRGAIPGKELLGQPRTAMRCWPSEPIRTLHAFPALRPVKQPKVKSKACLLEAGGGRILVEQRDQGDIDHRSRQLEARDAAKVGVGCLPCRVLQVAQQQSLLVHREGRHSRPGQLQAAAPQW